VEPEPGFEPKNWRDKPKSYRVIEYVGPKRFRGNADAWRFLHNQRQLQSNKLDAWAILLN
jgi:hypothetical protein